MLPAGREVVAIGHKGSTLIVSPSNKGTMRGSIAMDDTDFKEGVAYLFELRKRQRGCLCRDESEAIESSCCQIQPQKPHPIPLLKPR